MTPTLRSAVAVANGHERPEVAVYLRLSRETDDSASIETQRQAARRWCEQNGYDPDALIEYLDTNVSGAKPLEQRKGMRKLMAERPHVVIAWKLDRYARSVSEFLRLIAWGEANSVRLATTDNTINTTTPTGRMVAVVLAALAQWERELIASRVKDGHQTRRTQGRWASGPAPFGYRVTRKNGAAYLEIRPENAERVRAGIADLLDAGTVVSSCAVAGISETQWRQLIKGVTLRGQREHNGALILAEDGITPVQFADPIINAAEAKAVRERLEALANGTDRAPRGAAPRASGMAWCFKCGGKLAGGKSDKGVPRYKCKWGHVTITAQELDQRVEAEFLTRWGSFAEHVVRLEGGNDLSDQMIEAQEQADRLSERMATAGPLMLASLEKHAEELEATYAALRAAHDPDVREVLEPTGRTLGEAWKAESEHGKAKLLSDVGLHLVLYKRGSEERMQITWAVGGDDHELADMLGEMEAAK